MESEDHKLANRKYYERNRDRLRTKARKYYWRNREAVIQRVMRYYHLHRDEILVLQRMLRSHKAL